MNKMTHLVRNGESLIDIAVSQYGAESYVFQLISDNPGLTPDTPLSAGQELTLDRSLAAEKENRVFDMVGLTSKERPRAKTEVVVREGQSLADLAIDHYGDISYLFQLLEDNPHLLATDTDVLPGDLIFIDRQLGNNKTDIDYQYISLVGTQKQPNFRQVEIYQGQSVFDLTLQEYGDIQAAIDLLTDTNTDNIGTWVPPQTGSTIRIRKNRVYDADVTQYYQNRNIRINTGRRSLIEGIGLCSSDGVLLISFDNFILKASDQ